MPKARPPPDRSLLLRAVKWARLPGHGHTVAQACARFGITANAYRKAQRELSDEARIRTDDELMLSGLYPGRPTAVESLIAYYNWINHAGISPADVRVILRRLIADGSVRQVGDKFELAREWP